MEFGKILRHPIVLFLLLWGLLSIVVYLAIPEESELFTPVTYLFYNGSAVLSTIFLFYVFRFYGAKSLEGKVWLMIALGILLWTMGEFLWYYYEVIQGTDPFPSAADYLYVAAYVPLVVAFLYKLRFTRLKLDAKKIGAVVATILIILVPTYLFVFTLILEDEGAMYANGDPLDDYPYYSFTTVEQRNDPVYFVVDEDGLEEVSKEAVLVFEFDREVDQESVEDNFAMWDEDGEDVEGEITWNGTTMTFSPRGQLSQETFYEAEIYVAYGSVETTYSLIYPIMDLVLLAIALLIALYWAAEISKGWYIVSLAMMANAFADIGFTAMDWRGFYWWPIDLFWIWSYLLFAIGAIYQKKFHESFM